MLQISEHIINLIMCKTPRSFALSIHVYLTDVYSAYHIPDTVVGMGTTVIEGVQNMAVCYKNDFELKAQIPYLPKSRDSQKN